MNFFGASADEFLKSVYISGKTEAACMEAFVCILIASIGFSLRAVKYAGISILV